MFETDPWAHSLPIAKRKLLGLCVAVAVAPATVVLQPGLLHDSKFDRIARSIFQSIAPR